MKLFDEFERNHVYKLSFSFVLKIVGDIFNFFLLKVPPNKILLSFLYCLRISKVDVNCFFSNFDTSEISRDPLSGRKISPVVWSTVLPPFHPSQDCLSVAETYIYAIFR